MHAKGLSFHAKVCMPTKMAQEHKEKNRPHKPMYGFVCIYYIYYIYSIYIYILYIIYIVLYIIYIDTHIVWGY